MSTNRTHTSAEHFPLVPRMIATSFGVGYLPKAPGTWGALLAVVLWLPLYLWCSDAATVFYVTLAAAVIYCVAGTWASSVAERYWGKDPVVACADETVGMWISLLPLGTVATTPWWEILLAFVLFRLFDIYKPLGIRAMERLPRGYGMMADDILAGIYSIFVLLAVNSFI
ncbi:MAG: phosphatidylglycerophosphatase A [Bacteroides sp.]|nr:phosphatidylglycerophosphatase A [Bacteroides sp.]MCM1457803.1 phosphatidylglycerophosphatase A [Lachnoclostridium sp.]